LGILASEATRVTDEMFAAAAMALDEQVTDADFKLGRIYPSLTRIREVSKKIALAVARVAVARGLTTLPEPADLEDHIQAKMYDPTYVEIGTSQQESVQ
ncbi:MAG: malic enzyme-like NAD(P)-binding protein, partial [Smithellaceae bacterium]